MFIDNMNFNLTVIILLLWYMTYYYESYNLIFMLYLDVSKLTYANIYQSII